MSNRMDLYSLACYSIYTVSPAYNYVIHIPQILLILLHFVFTDLMCAEIITPFLTVYIILAMLCGIARIGGGAHLGTTMIYSLDSLQNSISEA